MTHLFNIEQAEAVIHETMLDLHTCLKLEDEEPHYSVSRGQSYSYSDINLRDVKRFNASLQNRIDQHRSQYSTATNLFPSVSITDEERLRFEQETLAKLKAEDARDPLHHCQDHPPLHPFMTFNRELKFAVREFKLSPGQEADVDVFKASFKTAQDNFINQYKKKMYVIENLNDGRNNTADYYSKIEQVKRACKVLLGVLLGIILCPALLSSNYRDWLGHTFFEKPSTGQENTNGTSTAKEVFEDTEDSKAIQNIFDARCAAM
ncbi:MAG: hypothetical protein K0U37_06680 [Gammaproteobacteria bacterium]|nr:hypothetical protein [Gammaproteobacteria bacterium]